MIRYHHITLFKRHKAWICTITTMYVSTLSITAVIYNFMINCHARKSLEVELTNSIKIKIKTAHCCLFHFITRHCLSDYYLIKYRRSDNKPIKTHSLVYVDYVSIHLSDLSLYQFGACRWVCANQLSEIK